MTEETIFVTALEKQTPAERQAYLDEVCAGNPQLRAQVEELLRADADAGSFLNHPPAGVDATVVTSAEHDTTSDKPQDLSLAFLEPCSTPGRLGKLVGKVGEYEVIEIVGQGGMGAVLRAFDTKLSRIVAVKIMAAELAANPMAVKRFLREAQSAAAIHHEHVVTIHAIDDTHRPPFIVMQYVEGLTLQQKIDNQGALELKQVLRIGSQMAAGLAAAHKHGLIHRDVKPANVLLENGVERVKITDFGLARAADDLEMTQTGIIAGTPQYMSPEQARGESVDARSDLFSLGSVLYTMCTGRPAFRAETTMGVLKRVCDEDPRPVREVNPEVPEWLAGIIGKLLAKNPDERFQSASEVAELLSQHLAHLQNPAHVPQPAAVAMPAPPLFVAPAQEPKPGDSSVATQKQRNSLAAATLFWGMIAIGLGVAALVILPLVLLLIPAIQRVRALSNNAILEVQCQENVHHAVVQVKKGEQVVATIDTRSESTAVVPEGDYRLQLESASWNTPYSLEEGEYVTEFTVEISPTSRFLHKGRRHQVFVERRSAKRRRDDLPSVADLRPREDGWIPLFNGQDLSGWDRVGGTVSTWQVDSSILRGGGNESYLLSKRHFKDFKLKAEMRISPGGEWVFWFRTDPKEFRPNRPGRRGLGARFTYKGQTNDVEGHMRMQVELTEEGRVLATNVANVKPHDWFPIELTVKGDKVDLQIKDGSVGASGLDVSYPAGPLAIQIPSTESTLEFRKIEVQELPPDPQLEGTWKAVSGETGGRAWPADELESHRVVFRGTTFQGSAHGHLGETTFQVQTTKEPKQIDIAKSATHAAMHGVYRVQGDTLTLCIAPDADNRPSSFESPAGTNTQRIVYHRESMTQEETANESKKSAQPTIIARSSRVFTGELTEGGDPNVFAIAMSPRDELVATGHFGGGVAIWNRKSGEQIKKLAGHEQTVSAIAFDADGKFLATGGEDSTIRLWSTDTWEEVGELKGHTGWINYLAFLGSGESLASVALDFRYGRDNSIRIWNTAERTERRAFTESLGHNTHAALSPDETLFAIANAASGRVRLWDLKTESPAHDFVGYPTQPVSVAFSRDGTRVAAGYMGRERNSEEWNDPENAVVRMWDVKSGELLQVFAGHAGPVMSLEFSPDDRWLLSLASGRHDSAGTFVKSSDHSLRIWEVATGRELVRIEPQTRVNVARWTPDGTAICSGTRLWSVPASLVADGQPNMRRLKLLDPSKEKPVPQSPAATKLAVTVENGAWRIENDTNTGNFHVLMATVLDEIPKDGIIVCRAHVKVKANDELTWGDLTLGDWGPGHYGYQWPAALSEYRGDVPEWTQKEVRYPAEAFHKVSPPQINIRFGLHANGVLWVRDLELLHIASDPQSSAPLWGKEQDGWQAGVGWKAGKQRFAAGEPVEFELKVRNTTDAPKTIEIDKPDGWDMWYSGGDELHVRIFGGKKEKLTLASKEEKTIDVPGAQIKTDGLNKGFYRVRFSTPFDGKERDLADAEFGFFLDREDPQPFAAPAVRTEPLKHPDDKYASVAWGEPVLGLSFGWQPVSDEEAYSAIEFFLWNTSAAAVQVKYLEHHPLDWQILLRDKNGKEIRSEPILTGPKVEANKRLAAGAVVSLGVTTVDQLWQAAGTPRDDLPAGSYKASSWFNCQRTDYGHLNLRLTSGEAAMEIKKQ